METPIRILVIDLGKDKNNPWNLFCGYDPKGNRLVFFRDLRMLQLPQRSDAGGETSVSITRAGTPIATGIPHIIGGHGEQFAVSGFEELKPQFTNPDKLPADLLNAGDVVTILKKDWGGDNPVDTIASRRRVGTHAWEVFAKRTSDLELIKEFFPEHSNISMARAIFETYPGSFYQEFY